MGLKAPLLVNVSHRINKELGTVHYLRAGGAEILRRGHLFLASRRWGTTFFWRKQFWKARETHFPRDSGKNETKKIFEQIFIRGGALFLAASKIKISAPSLPINNEASLTYENAMPISQLIVGFVMTIPSDEVQKLPLPHLGVVDWFIIKYSPNIDIETPF